MARPLHPDPSLKVTRDEPSADREALRAEWRDNARRRYWSSEEARLAKIEAVREWRERHPERANEVARETSRRRKRGLQRAYRKAVA